MIAIRQKIGTLFNQRRSITTSMQRNFLSDPRNRSAELTGLIPWNSENPLGKPLDEYGLSVIAKGIDPVIDIVAVHGLDGHREGSWKATNGTFWLEDLLPSIIPNAQILSYGYDGKTHTSHGGITNQFLYELGEELLVDLSLYRRRTKSVGRPIIFLAHSFGGVLVKNMSCGPRVTSECFLTLFSQALIKSDSVRRGNLEKLKDIKLSTSGILFFGTPHLGNINTKVFQHLESDSEILREQVSAYAQISRDFDNKFFCEKYGTPTGFGFNKVVVPAACAIIPGTPDAEVYHLSKNHKTLVKFDGANDSGFIKVSSVLSEMAEECSERIAKNWTEWDAGLSKERVHCKSLTNLPYIRSSTLAKIRSMEAGQDEQTILGSQRPSLSE